MSLNKEDYIARLDTALQDNAEKLQPDDKLRLLSQAVLIFSKDTPQEKIHELTGDASAYDFALPSDWVDGFSSFLGKMEYPADQQNPTYLEASDWVIFKKLVLTVATGYIRFLTFTPATSKVARLTYIAPHTLNDATNTISDNNAEAVIALTASLCFWALAAKFAQSSDNTLDVDVIDYQRKSDIYATLAKEQLAAYNSLMGLGDEAKKTSSAVAGTVFKDLDIRYATGADYITHPSHQR